MKLFVRWAKLTALVLLLLFICVKWDIDPFIIYAIRFLVTVAFAVLIVYLYLLAIKVAFKQNKVLDKTMAETLTDALDSESSPLFAEIYASILRFGKSAYYFPCFLGLTNTRLLMVVMDNQLAPTQTYSFPLTDISSCEIKKSIMPNQYILALHFDDFYIRYRLYCKVNNLENQNSNVLYLLDELGKYARQSES